MKPSSKWCWTLYSLTVKQSLPQITVSRNSTKDTGGNQCSTGMIGAMAAHCVPSIFSYGEGKNNARLASQKAEVERRWDTIRVSERRGKVIRSKVACRSYTARYAKWCDSESRHKKEACAKQPVRKNNQKYQSPSASFICYLCSCSAGCSLWFNDKTLDAIREAGLTAWQRNSI